MMAGTSSKGSSESKTAAMAKQKPLDVLKWMFEDPERYDSLSSKEKADAFFIVNRMMAIMFPAQAELLNKAGGMLAERLDFWRDVVRKRTNKTPGWVFVKPKKPSSGANAVRLSDLKASEEALIRYSEAFSMGAKDLEDYMRLAPESLKSTLKKVDQQIKTIDGDHR